MLERIKQEAINQAMKLISHPKVSKLLSDQRTLKLMQKGFELHQKIKGEIKNKLELVNTLLNRSPKP